MESRNNRAAVTPAQVLLLWLTQQQISVIPRAGSGTHIQENAAVGRHSGVEDGRGVCVLTSAEMRDAGRAVEGLLRAGAGMPPVRYDAM